LFDLLAKLGQEDDAYHATCLVLMDYSDDAEIPDTGEEPHEGVPEPGLELDTEADLPATAPGAEIDQQIMQLPKVKILKDETPEVLDPGRFPSCNGDARSWRDSSKHARRGTPTSYSA